jgi:hypothetical protein
LDCEKRANGPAGRGEEWNGEKKHAQMGSGMVRKNTSWHGFGVFNSGSGIVRKYDGLVVES